MIDSAVHNPNADPPAVRWATTELPTAWPDRLRPWLPWELARLVWSFLRRRRPVELPAGVPGAEQLPKYLLQEFHNLPNGNWSRSITKGYVHGFERMMLGHMRAARQRIAAHLLPADSVLDVGTAGGSTAADLLRRGAGEVWGLDPSPYLLQHAARQHPDVRFVQGVAERLPFPDARFAAVAACFLLHELPPTFARQALREFHRVLRPGGRLAICEPSPTQLRVSAWRLWRRFGWRGPYYRWLARRVHEPFVQAWHALDAGAELRAAGFTVVADEEQFPSRHLQAIAI
ncbi:MAG: class I SAM-dependent methyltransferase [Planctomycetes bacterium]|nr:class I SAM-dependent methyltransferase [Planctomycetota bacterium]